MPRVLAALSPHNLSATGLLVLFAATLLLSATLLFAIQPMFTKMVLPMLGGSPAVWNTAMLFFQSMLLAGYAYAHLTSRMQSWRRQAMLHLTLLLIAFVALPIMPIDGWLPPADGFHVLWLIGLFAASIGLPFFVVSANAPLLQRWFAASGHPAAGDPYFLYGASNLGSIVALLAYPTVVQPLLGLHRQSVAWTAGYAALVVLIGMCALAIRRAAGRTAHEAAAAAPALSAAGASSWRLRLQWIVYALVPSSLMLGVTTHISTDVAVVPLLWVLPLTLYLLSFVIVFSRRPLLKHDWMVKLLPYVAILVTLNLLGISKAWLQPLLLHLATFFVCAMVCHGELVRRRPAARDLTEFYLFMSLGGMLGGVFNALLAPLLFDAVVEYPLALVAVCLLRPQDGARQWAKDLALPVLLFAAFVLVRTIPDFQLPAWGTMGNFVFLVAISLVVFSFKEHSLRFALGIGTVIAGVTVLLDKEEVIARDRGFFGVHRVQAADDGRIRQLLHGTTIHGAQFTDPPKHRTQLLYYYRGGTYGQLFAAYGDRPQTQRVAVVGLGAGALSCYRRPGQDWDFYEIDPIVLHLARDSGLFHYLRTCADEAPVIMGDARLTLRQAPDRHYGMIVADAFNSDAIPIHLMTREAVLEYLSKLAEDGLIVFHISNRYLDLAPVLAGVARESGLKGRYQYYSPTAEQAKRRNAAPSEMVVLARDDRHLAPLDKSGKWRRLADIPAVRAWTDNYSNIFGAIR